MFCFCEATELLVSMNCTTYRRKKMQTKLPFSPKGTRLDSSWNLLANSLSPGAVPAAVPPRQLLLFPAVTATEANLRLTDADAAIQAEICIHACSDGTHALSSPVVQPELNATLTASALNKLLLPALDVARRSQSPAVRALIMPDDRLTEAWRQTLLIAGFEHIATAAILQRKIKEAEPRPAALTTQSIHTRSAQEVQQDASLHQRVLPLLQQITSVSDDLSQLPVPQPEQMLSEWAESAGVVLLSLSAGVNSETILSGICVFTTDTESDSSLPTTTPNLLYLGVHPDHRRQRIATHLLESCSATLSSNGIRFLRVAVDQQNESAMAFYRSEAFAMICQQQILICRLSQN